MPQRLVHKANHIVVAGMSGHGDDKIFWRVVPTQEIQQGIPAETADGFLRSNDRAPHGVNSIQCSVKQIENVLIRRVLVHFHLLDHHILFTLYFLLRKYGIQDEIEHSIKRTRQVLIQTPGVEAGVFLGGKCIQIAADVLHTLGDMVHASVRCAFEHHVFNEVAHTGLM